jgi:hypothetical protein
MKHNETLELFADFKLASAYARALTLKFKETPTLMRSGSGYAILASDSLIAKIRKCKSSEANFICTTATNESNISKTPRVTPLKKSTSKLSAITAHEVTIHKLSPSIGRITKERFSRMTSEIRLAYNVAPASIMTEWVNNTLSLLASAFVRRVRNVVDLVIVLMETVGREIINLAFATLDGKFGKHAAQRSKDLSAASTAKVNGWAELLRPLVSSFRQNPSEIGPDLIVASLAFAFASGGFDGDGGVPDSDITMFGIDAHRSIFTHSILSGVVIEAGLYSMVDFISRAYTYLPKNHDPLWDTMHKSAAEATELAAKGVSVGLAYHFGVDALVQPAAYHDLPFPAPIEAHQTIMGANAVSEGFEIVKKPKIGLPTNKCLVTQKPMKPRDIAGIAVSGVGVLLCWMMS